MTANNIRHFRYCKMLKQSELAEKMGFKSNDRISMWESGKTMPSVENLFRLAQILGVMPHEVYPDLLKLISHDPTSLTSDK